MSEGIGHKAETWTQNDPNTKEEAKIIIGLESNQSVLHPSLPFVKSTHAKEKTWLMTAVRFLK